MTVIVRKTIEDQNM